METKVFTAQLAQLHDMLDFLKAYCVKHDIPQRVIGQIILAGEEALVNVISYGFPKEVKGLIELGCDECQPKGIIVVIKDKGIAFNPLENVPPVLPPVNRLLEKTNNSLGGYGIYILTELMDTVEYQRINDENILTLTKYI